MLSLVALASVAMIVAAACGKSNKSTTTTPPQQNFTKGGTLQVALESDVEAGMDPQREYYTIGFSYLQMMARTLLTYQPLAGNAGNVPVPDLAASLPTITNNAMTWTFKLRPGVKFGPPLNRPITCADFQTAMKREATTAVAAPYSFYYTDIQGFSDYAAGKATDISGVQCPDPNTVVYQLTTPTGDFNYRVTLPASAPVPAEAIKGHDQDYGRFLVPSGCYMWQGEDQVDFSSARPTAPGGYQPGKSITMVRNPDWDPATDPIRKCYLDQIDISIGGDPSDLYNKVQQGSLDFVDDDPQTAAALKTFRADPTLSKQILPGSGETQTYGTDATSYVAMNLQVAPFDDIHVRKAVNWIINKDAFLRLAGGPDFGEVATHVAPPSMSGALPATYNPYATPGNRGDLTKAKAEMMQSKYDTNHDGICDASACQDVFSVGNSADPFPAQDASVASDLAKIGIHLKTRALDTGTMYNLLGTPARKVAIGLNAAWAKDYADLLTFIKPLFDGRTISPSGNVNYSMVNDPTVNADIDKCAAQTGAARATCWDGVDTYLMENVVPWAPTIWQVTHYVVSNRIARFAYTQFAASSALDAIALAPAAAKES